MSLAHCSALVAAVDRAAHIDDADKATLGELAQQVPWEASDASTIARALSGNKRQKLQHEEDEANGRDLEESQEAFVEAEEAAAEALETLRLSGNKRQKMQHEQDEANGRDLE